MDVCAFHSKQWRGRIQCLLNKVRGSLLSNQHIKLFSKAVCTCKGSPSVPIASAVDLRKWVDEVQANKTFESIQLYPFLDEVESSTCGHYLRESLLRVLSVIKAAVEGDFSALSPSGQPSKPPKPTLTFELPISCRHLGVYFGSAGSYLKPLCQEYAVKVQVVSKGSVRGRHVGYMTGEGFEVRMEGGEGASVDLALVREKLLARAKTVQESRKKHEDNVAEFYKIRAARRVHRVAGAGTRGGAVTSAKEAAVEQFEKKQAHKKPKSKGSPDKKSSSVLSDGRCFNCLVDYHPGQTGEGACSYHSGYLVPLKAMEGDHRAKWSCCDLRSVNQHPTHKDHTNTGCTSGRHVWRPGKAAKNNTKPVLKDPDFTVH